MAKETRPKFTQFPAGAKGICFQSTRKRATTPIAVAHIFVFAAVELFGTTMANVFEPELSMDPLNRTSNTKREGLSTFTDPQCQPPNVMRMPLVDVVLVMSCGQFAHPEAAVLKKAPSFSCSMVYNGFNHQQDLLVVLDLMDRVFFVFVPSGYCCTSNVIMVQSPSCGRRSVAPYKHTPLVCLHCRQQIAILFFVQTKFWRSLPGYQHYAVSTSLTSYL